MVTARVITKMYDHKKREKYDFSSLISSRSIALISVITLKTGEKLQSFEIGYRLLSLLEHFPGVMVMSTQYDNIKMSI